MLSAVHGRRGPVLETRLERGKILAENTLVNSCVFCYTKKINDHFSENTAMTTEHDKQIWRGAWEWVRTLVLAVLAVVILFTFVGRLSRVDGESMRETLQDGDLLVVLNAFWCGSYEPGDLVILCKEGFHNGEPIVKRVIATEGQTVDIDFSAGTVFVDGVPLEEPYVREPTWTAEGMEFPLTVPEGSIFVMGDNRNDSDDSRNPELGPVDSRLVIGRAVFLILPGETAELERREWSRIGILN